METVVAKDYVHLLEHYNGLLGLKLKIPIKDSYSLALVYTPGVGKSCMEIKADIKNSLIYTNKGNSIIVLTDSSHFLETDPQWTNNCSIPFVEAKSVYYKLQANIDAYPMVLDLALIKSEDDVLEILHNLTAAYAGFEILSMAEGRLNALLEKYEKKKFEAVLITHFERAHLRTKLAEAKLTEKVDENIIISAAFRAALDTQSFTRFPVKIFDEVITFLQSQTALLDPHNHYKLTAQVMRFIAEKLKEQGLAAPGGLSPYDVEHRFVTFCLEGPHAWIELPKKR
jgi:hypothetical protein